MLNKILGVFFAISCFATSGLSGSMLGVGMWFWIIVATGFFVAISQFVPGLRGIGTVAASILGVIAILAALLALFVVIGGSGPSNEDILLILGFVMIAVFGFSLVRINRNVK